MYEHRHRQTQTQTEPEPVPEPEPEPETDIGLPDDPSARTGSLIRLLALLYKRVLLLLAPFMTHAHTTSAIHDSCSYY